jgi:hypothetical protein
MKGVIRSTPHGFFQRNPWRRTAEAQRAAVVGFYNIYQGVDQ